MDSAREAARLVCRRAAAVFVSVGRRGESVTPLMNDLMALLDREERACRER